MGLFGGSTAVTSSRTDVQTRNVKQGNVNAPSVIGDVHGGLRLTDQGTVKRAFSFASDALRRADHNMDAALTITAKMARDTLKATNKMARGNQVALTKAIKSEGAQIQGSIIQWAALIGLVLAASRFVK